MENLQKNIISIIKSDIFISYSHDDEEYAKMLAETLQYHALTTFVDCLYCKNIDSALNKYDILYCRNSSGGYDYKKRNKSTATFHMILADSIIEMVKNANVFIKLNTESYSKHDDRTISPWIYLECKIAKLMKSDSLKRSVIINDALNESKILFKVPEDSGFIDVYSIKELISVLNNYL